MTAPAAVRLDLTRDLLARLGGLAARLAAAGTRAVTLVLPQCEMPPAGFRNPEPARPDLPAVLDAVAPVQRFLADAQRFGIDAHVEGFPRGIFDGVEPDPPVTAMIEVSSRCNLRCPLCSVGRRSLSRWGDMPVAVFERIVGDLAPSVRRLALHNLGEPLLHAHLPELVRIAKRAGIAEVFLSTNLAVDAPNRVRDLARSGIDEIVCSIDSATGRTYDVYRVGGDFGVVRANLDVLREERRASPAAAPRVRLQFLLFRHNEGERAEFRALAAEYGMGYEVKVASAPGEEDAWLPAEPGLRRADREADHGWCQRPFQHTTILSDGTVVPCCKDADAKHPLGCAAETPFAEIWHGAAYRDFRRRITESKSSIPLCRECPGGWFRSANVVEAGEDPCRA